MAERKVLNKYYPPDFDPSKIPRRSGPKNSQQVVRLMAPFSMRCNSCGEFIYKGKKFNARKETVEGETYYGIRIFSRNYIQNRSQKHDYVAEHGAQRNFEPWREESAVEEEDRLARLEEEENNPMKALENRTVDSKREMDILDALQDIRARNARNEKGSAGQDRDRSRGGKRRLEDEEDEKLVREVFAKIPVGGDAPGPSGSGSKSPRDGSGSPEPETPATSEPTTITVKRKAGDIAPDLKSLLSESHRAMVSKPAAAPPPAKKRRNDLAGLLGVKPKGKAKA
ncbi:coiled-coil domain-containing protein [Rhizoctonia solani]|uniref:Splicing factor YJU2 n=1 Tax=Rhizoctonia solani TaxID=456999 RepID=A0A8H8PBX3_9AGAM|nr:coiled-coil domain-containing protein [Rhizoctonia solani]QRW27336.1 coiled-coil domain-containing protein [Rhizoctonia solani]